MSYLLEKSRLQYNRNSDYNRTVVISKSTRNYTNNQKIVEVLNSNSWLNQPSFIIGGGESIKGLDFSLLDNFNTIGINKTFQYYSKAKINYSMDVDFYNKIHDGTFSEYSGMDVKEKWLSFQGHRIFLTPLAFKNFGTDVHVIRRLPEKFVSRNLDVGIYSGKNSAMGALMLAVALGSTTIYLLGYDMIAKTQSHWHDGYAKRDIEEFNIKLDQYKQEFVEMQPLLEEAGVTVINLNPNSNLKCFPFSTLEETLKGLTSANL